MDTWNASTQAWFRAPVLEGKFKPRATLSSLFLYCIDALRKIHFYGMFRSFRKKIYREVLMRMHYEQHQRLSMTLDVARKNGGFQNDDRVIYKPMYRYVARFMSTADRYHALLFHYSFFSGKLKNMDASRKIASGITIWRKNTVDGAIHVRLEYAERTRLEGELALAFFHNATRLQTMTFSFLHSDTLGFGDGAVLFIGGNQGEKCSVKAARIATKLNDEISPSAMLLIVAQALGMAIKINSIVGVSAMSQIRGGIANNVRQYRSSYDELWTVSGGRRIEDKAFILPFDEAELPILSKNRSRTRRKRAVKTKMRNEILHNVEELFSPS